MIPDDPSDPVSQSTKLSQMRPDDHRCSRTSPDDAYVIRNGSRDVGQRPARSDHPSSTFPEQLLGLTITAARSWKLWPVWVSEMVTCNKNYSKTIPKPLLQNYSKTTPKKLLKKYSKNYSVQNNYSTTIPKLLQNYSKTTQNYSKTTLKLLGQNRVHPHYSKTTLKLLKNYSVSKTSLKLLQNDCKTIIPKILQICSKTTQNYSKTTLKLLGQKHVF